MFFLKKIITAFILPPGFLILMFFVLAFFLILKKYYKFAILQLLTGLLIWVISIDPVSSFFIHNLEKEYIIEENLSCDVIVLLGGGVYEFSDDITGKGFPSGDMLARIVTTARMQKQLEVPIIISFGNAYEEKYSHAQITLRLLTDLGIKRKDIIIEDKSRDTYENAIMTKIILTENAFQHPLLITSGFHLKRAQFIFNKLEIKSTPLPAYRMTANTIVYRWHDFLPRADNIYTLSLALHEYIGLWFYKIVYRNV